MRLVPAEAWEATVAQLRSDGYTFFDWLGCVDEIGRRDVFRVVLALRDLSRSAEPALLLGTEVPRAAPQLASLRHQYAGAGWHEREATDLFGIEFVGGEARRLLLDEAYEGTPLRKDDVLAARTGLDWPGAKEPGESDQPDPSAAGALRSGRRRASPPGVPDPAVWGDREAPEAAGPEEVAESAVGGRVRRRRP